MTPVSPAGGHVDVDGKGKVWVVTRKGGLRFDPDTAKFTDFISLSVDNPKFSTYDLLLMLRATVGGRFFGRQAGNERYKNRQSRELQFAPRSEMREIYDSSRREFYSRTEKLGPLSKIRRLRGFRTPRRLAGDHSENLMWAADFLGQDIASVDIRTLKVNYYDLPVPIRKCLQTWKLIRTISCGRLLERRSSWQVRSGNKEMDCV